MVQHRPIAALALPLLLAACAAPQATPRAAGAVAAEESSFPTRDVIARIAAAPVPARLSDEKSRDVPGWELTGPLPDAVDRSPPRDDSPWGKLLADAAAKRADDVVLTESMHCVAREQAAFYLANDARPAEMLERFIAARCGAPTSMGGSALQIISGDPRTPDEAFFTQFGERIRGMLDKTLPPGRLEAGLAYVRKGGRAVVAIAVTQQTVRLDRTPLVPGPDGKVVIRGEALLPAVGLRALVNRGRYGYAECAVSTTEKLPRFAITCDTARDDEVAWLSVSALPPGRVLGTALLEMLVWPSGTASKTYPKLARAAAVAQGTSPDEVLQEINRVRAEAKLPPLRVAEAESRTASRLAPHYFSALEGGGADGVADQVALGMLAGWDVEGLVRNGHFVSTWLPDATSWAEVVRAALSRPIGRETLLDPTAERIAIGPMTTERAHGAIFGTYALFDTYRHDDDLRLLATRITALRAERGAAPPRLVGDLNQAALRAARLVQAGERAPTDALKELMAQASEKLGRSVRGWVAETTSLERGKLPDELATAKSLTLGIGVAHLRHPGQAWGRFVVLIVMIDEGGAPLSARREGPSGG
jgi:hypothetical protein